tara:strand:- start:134 stop:763 length:630 start_codon:yes stop_codon:yes gene_type:complete
VAWEYYITVMKVEVKVLSLKKRQDRRDYTDNHLKTRYDYTFWDAIDGKTYQFTPEENKLFKNSEFHTYNVSPDAVKGLCLSNYRMWEYAVKNNTNLVIFEDDVIITSPEWFNWEEMFKDDFDLHFLTNQKEFANCYSYLVSVNGAKKLIKHFNEVGFVDILDNDLRCLPKDKFNARNELFNHFGTFSPHGKWNFGSDVLLEGHKSHIKS